MMKKYMMSSVFLVISGVLLFGCSDDEENKGATPNQVEEENENMNRPDEQVNAEENETNNEEEKDDAESDIDTFIEEVTKINKELESFSIESKMDTTQTYDGEKNHSISTQQQDTIFDPFQSKKHMVTEQQEDSDYDEGGVNDEEIT